ncbi:flagellar motor protein MotB [Naasia sp. SYSU D00057]|uniref:OmpA/MotB family protein n=1 Tax=Naasia sp. SYSU D00057 TaxID=2817380 RepID=UPI0027DAB624|nr:flagellar motor protein MotB [Naasia sp. SYSU D00057]
MSGHKKRRGGHGGEFHMDERWMTSYADMVTVLMCLFIVLYAMSSVDQAKFEKLANSLATGFGQTPSQTVDTAEGVVVPADLVDSQGEGFTPLQLAQLQVHELEDIKHRIDLALDEAGVAAEAISIIDADGLTVGLVGEDTFFDGNSAQLKATAEEVLRSIAPVLAPLANQITVEGHADPHGSPAPFATDWELSAARSTAVLRFLVEGGGVQGTSISSVSYGSTRPNKLAEQQSGQENRRVDIVIHPTSTDEVSALIPDVVAGATDEAGDEHAKAEEHEADTHTEAAGTGGH